MKAFLRGIESWFEAPEQELLQYEMEWFGRWLFQRKNCWLLIVIFLLSIFPFSGWLVWPIRFGVWLYLFQRRVVSRFSRGNLEEMLVLPINGRMIWPALLSAPLGWLILAEAARAQGAIIQGAILASVGQFLGAESVFLFSYYSFLWSPVKIIGDVVFCILVARFTVPNGSFGKLFMFAFLVYIGLAMLSCLFPVVALIGWLVLRDMRSAGGWNTMLLKASNAIGK